MAKNRSSASTAARLDDSIAEHVRWAVNAWPQIDPEVEGIFFRLDRIHLYLRNAFRASLGQAGLTQTECHVLMEIRRSTRSHGELCRELEVSTGTMTNRLDKLEQGGLIRRLADPNDRRGVLLELTAAGAKRLEDYVEAGAMREKELLSGLTQAEKQQLNQLLSKLLVSLQSQQPH